MHCGVVLRQKDSNLRMMCLSQIVGVGLIPFAVELTLHPVLQTLMWPVIHIVRHVLRPILQTVLVLNEDRVLVCSSASCPPIYASYTKANFLVDFR